MAATRTSYLQHPGRAPFAATVRAAQRPSDVCAGHGPFPHTPDTPACDRCGYWPWNLDEPQPELWMPADPMELVAAVDRMLERRRGIESGAGR